MSAIRVISVIVILLNLLNVYQCDNAGYIDVEDTVEQAVSLKQYQYIASIVRAQHGVCTGSLFTRQYVLTSAVCSFAGYDDTSQLPVPEDKSIFELRLKSERVDSGGALQTILHIYIHPKFRAVDSQTQYDASIFKIVWIFFLGSSLSLAPATYLNNEKAERLVQAKTKCETVGWGYIGINEVMPVTPQLRRIKTVIVPWKTCASLTNLSLAKGPEICGIVSNRTCFLTRGSGSPLLCDDEVVGLAAWGSRCSSDRQPLVFTQLDSWVMPFVRTRSSQRRSHDFSLSSKLEAPHLCNLLIFVSYPILISLARRFNYFSKYIN